MSLLAASPLLSLGRIASAVDARPCDIFGASGTPCVAAHSSTRALYSEYSGPLYEVTRTADNTTKKIYPIQPGGLAAATDQEAFCSARVAAEAVATPASPQCFVSTIFDQSGNGNDLTRAPAGQNTPQPDDGVDATKGAVSIGGNSSTVYGLLFDNSPPDSRPGNKGYRNDNTSKVPVGDAAQTIYAVLDGRHWSYHCCFDYGNAETDNNDHGASTMEALYWGSRKPWPHSNPPDAGEPYVMADLEDGLWADEDGSQKPVTLDADFAFGMLKGDSGNHWALKHADAQRDGLQTTYDGVRPAGYKAMHKQGAIILGIGGDNSNRGRGTFYEGAILQGFSSDAADNAVQAEVARAGYAKKAQRDHVYV